MTTFLEYAEEERIAKKAKLLFQFKPYGFSIISGIPAEDLGNDKKTEEAIYLAKVLTFNPEKREEFKMNRKFK